MGSVRSCSVPVLPKISPLICVAAKMEASGQIKALPSQISWCSVPDQFKKPMCPAILNKRNFKITHKEKLQLNYWNCPCSLQIRLCVLRAHMKKFHSSSGNPVRKGDRCGPRHVWVRNVEVTHTCGGAHRWGMRLWTSLPVTFHFCFSQTVKEWFWRQDSSDTRPLSASHDQPEGPAVSVSLCPRKAGYHGENGDSWKKEWEKAWALVA